MKHLLLAFLLLTSTASFAYTTYYSDGSTAQTFGNTTYFSDGSTATVLN